MLSNVPEPRYFKVADGTVLKNLSDLGAALLHMEENIFRHHVTSDRNDFFNWVRDVHKDQRLALELMHAKTRQDAAISVNRRVQELLQPTPIPLPAASSRPMVKPEVKEIKQLFSPKPTALPTSKPLSRPVALKEPLRSLALGSVPSSGSFPSSVTLQNPSTKSAPRPVSRRRIVPKAVVSPTIVSVSRNVTPVRNTKKNVSSERNTASPTSSRFAFFSDPLQRRQLIIAAVAVVFLFFFLGTSSQVINLTGAAVTGPSPEEIQFVGIWGAIAVIVLVVVALKVIKERHSRSSKA